jgi:hypothetical protein
MEGSATTIVSALTTGFTTIASDMQSGLAQIVPIALPVLGGILLIRYGIRIFKSITGR